MAALRYLLVYVSDVARSKAFYSDVLGLEVLEDFGDFVRLGTGADVGLSLHVAGRLEAACQGVELNFEVDDVDRTHRDLADRGVAFTQPPKDMPWGARHAYLRDPDGHPVSLFTRPGAG